MKILVTGAAGFIGYHLTKLLISEDHEVVGLDNINDYYDPNLKFARLGELGIQSESITSNVIIGSQKFLNLRFVKADLSDHDYIIKICKEEKFECVVNLAAQAGVRYSMTNPRAYTRSNIDGFLNILEGCRHGKVKNLVFASTSSVYGLNTKLPLEEDDPTEHPMTLYAATKKANELMAHSYSHLFNFSTTGLRFFTVYGPWGRPDMALFLFAKAIYSGNPIQLFNNGEMVRDFTYVEDIVQGIKLVILNPAQADQYWDGNSPRISTSSAQYRILNIGNSKPVELIKYVEALENSIGKKALKEYLPMQQGDVPATHASIQKLESEFGFKPKVSVEEGIKKFIDWYKIFYKV